MSSPAVPIPKRKEPIRPHHYSNAIASPSSSSSTVPRRTSLDSPSSSLADRYSHFSSLSKSPIRFDRPEDSMATSFDERGGEAISPRRPSLLGSSLSRSEYTVINLGHGDGPPRLVTCVKSSQGFDWNQELFLPSYAAYESHNLEHKPDPICDIVLTDEEAAAIFP